MNPPPATLVTPDPNAIIQNIHTLNDHIERLAIKAGRSVKNIKVIAVSKTQSPEAIGVARQAGCHEFGENIVQEATSKISAIADASIAWHFIGHLQSKKAKLIPGQFKWLHSLDSLSLAHKLARATDSITSTLNVLLQVNISADPNKYGLAIADVMPLLESLLDANLARLIFRGLMTIGPYSSDEHEQRKCFAQLRELQLQCQSQFGLKQFDELSMGMSNDYPSAIMEGATLLRIGTKIFGQRR